MKRLITTTSLIATLVASTAFADIVIFSDGSRMEVSSYEVKGAMVLLTTLEGKLQSVPRTYVDMEATEKANRGSDSSAPATEAAPRPPEAPPPPPAAPPQPPAAPPIPEPPPDSDRSPPPPPSPEAAAPLPPAEAVSPPLVWTDEGLEVSLVAPSGDWRMQPMSASLDVAVQLTNAQTQGRATLALIRRRMRNYEDFQEATREIEDSLAATTSYQIVDARPLSVDPYTAYEIRFTKDVAGTIYYYRMVVFYSRDLAYALNMSCPEEALQQNVDEFEALIKGLVIKKTRNDITPRGVPRS